MKEQDRYVFPAVLTYEDGQEIAVVFPDLDVATSGTNERDALLSARELLGVALCGMEEDGEEIPAPSALGSLAIADNERAILVDVFMPSVRAESRNAPVNQTVTLPAWMNAAAREQNINVSQVLQDALNRILNGRVQV